MQRYGILGGTFDPIHVGHLVIAQAALQEFRLDKICFVPSGQPPHKNGVTGGEHRYQMTMLATIDNPHFMVSRVELDRSGYSYTFDTVRYFAEQFRQQRELFFITGADVLPELHKWHRYQELLQSCRFVVATRPGFSLQNTYNLTTEDIGRINYLEIPLLEISSTDIRRRVQTGRPIKYLVPSGVESYIYKHGLYRGAHST